MTWGAASKARFRCPGRRARLHFAAVKTAAYFQGKRVAITGGSGGIGLALARQLLGFGAEVTLLARRPGPLDEASDLLRREHPSARVSTCPVDVADAEAVQRALGPLAASGLEVLISCAGTVTPGRFVELPASEFRREMDVNFFGVVNACAAVVPHFVARGAGHVINVGSLGGVIGIYGYTAYAPSKFAVVGFSQALRAELKPHGVRVTVAHPPDTDTSMLRDEQALRPPETRAIAGTAAVRSPEDIAARILRGAAAGAFDVWCGAGPRTLALAHAVVPGLLRWYGDGVQARASTTAEDSPSGG